VGDLRDIYTLHQHDAPTIIEGYPKAQRLSDHCPLVVALDPSLFAAAT
jgi:hypothetical protein